MNRHKHSLGIAAAILVLILTACGGRQATGPSSAASAGSPVASTGSQPATSVSATSAAARPTFSGASSSLGVSPKASTQQLTKLSVGYVTVTSASTVPWVAEGAGLFRKYGFDTTLQYIAPATFTAALISGSMDVGYGSPGNIATADAQGADLVLIGAAFQGPIFSIVAGSGIKSLDGLRGKTVASTQIGSSTDIVLRDVLQQQGLTKDVTITHIPDQGAMLAALKSGGIQAAVLNEPITSLAVGQGGTVVYDQVKNGVKSIGSVIAVKKTYLSAHRDELKKFLMANMEAVHLMKTNPQLAAQYTAKYLKISDPKVLQNALGSMTHITDDDLGIPNDALQDIIKTTAVTNPAVAKFQPKDLVDLSLIQEIKASHFLDQLGSAH